MMNRLSGITGIIYTVLLIGMLISWIFYLFNADVSTDLNEGSFSFCLPGEKEIRGYSVNGGYTIMCMKG